MIAAVVAALLAQTDPTPFWMPPPPPKTEKEKKEQPKKKKKPPPVKVKPVEIPAKPTPPPPPEQPTWLENGDSQLGHSIGTVNGDTHRGQSPDVVPKTPVVVPISPAESPAPEAARLTPPVAAPPRVPPPIVVEAPEPEPPAPELRRWTVSAIGGAWGVSRSDGSGRSWDFTYGLRGGYALSESAEIDLQVARSAATAGSPFVSATAARHLVAARVFYVFGDTYALLLGGGGGATVVHTEYALLPSTDPGATASGLDAWAIKAVMEITGAARARFFRGLEARAEVSLLLRDGRIEILPLFAVGAAF